jgi:hypothetical protein
MHAPRGARRSGARRSSVRMLVIHVNHPALRSPAAGGAAEEHRSAVAAHAVVMSGHVAADPLPHKSPYENWLADKAVGKGSATFFACVVERITDVYFANCRGGPDSNHCAMPRSVAV